MIWEKKLWRHNLRSNIPWSENKREWDISQGEKLARKERLECQTFPKTRWEEGARRGEEWAAGEIHWSSQERVERQKTRARNLALDTTRVTRDPDSTHNLSERVARERRLSRNCFVLTQCDSIGFINQSSAGRYTSIGSDVGEKVCARLVYARQTRDDGSNNSVTDKKDRDLKGEASLKRITWKYAHTCIPTLSSVKLDSSPTKCLTWISEIIKRHLLQLNRILMTVTQMVKYR